jgi:hypothetical protein
MNNKIKYPRTPHLMWSESISKDDRKLTSINHFIGKDIVMSEKRDGENSTLMRNCTYARSLNSIDHPSRHWLKGLWGNIRFDIPEGWRICGENLYAKHSISYTNLKNYFEVFSIWNENNECLSYNETKEWCELLGLTMVPFLWKGIFDENFLRNYKIDVDNQEGYVIRLSDKFKFEDFDKSVAKWVRKDHITSDKHWMYNKISPNIIKEEITLSKKEIF